MGGVGPAATAPRATHSRAARGRGRRCTLARGDGHDRAEKPVLNDRLLSINDGGDLARGKPLGAPEQEYDAMPQRQLVYRSLQPRVNPVPIVVRQFVPPENLDRRVRRRAEGALIDKPVIDAVIKTSRKHGVWDAEQP